METEKQWLLATIVFYFPLKILLKNIYFEYDRAEAFVNGRAIIYIGINGWYINKNNEKIEHVKTHKEKEREAEEKRERANEKKN